MRRPLGLGAALLLCSIAAVLAAAQAGGGPAGREPSSGVGPAPGAGRAARSDPAPVVPSPTPNVGPTATASPAVGTAGEPAETTEPTLKPSPSPGGDVLAPVTAVEGARDGAWYGAALTLLLSAADEDGGSGVAYTEYKLDDAPWAPGAKIVVPAPADHSGDGLHLLLYRSADHAGNVEKAQSLSVGVDTSAPVAQAPAAATVMRYRTATLRYAVADAAPNAGTAEVTITIRNGAGEIVRTFAAGVQPVNTALSVSFVCSLPVGGYRFSVAAVDAAGNRAALAAVNRLTVTAPWSVGLPFRFRVSGLTLRDIDPSTYPLLGAGRVTPRVDREPHDAAGVRMFWYGGRLYNHVVGQATYGLRNLATYKATGDGFYLRRAQAQARRLMARRRLVGAAWFHPYDFPFWSLKAPWYSAMGQGLSLALFNGLYQVGGEAAYLEAARGTFASFLRRGPSSSPWVVNVDGSGYLWLQEYPGSSPDYTLNGHIYAVYGLYDHYRLTGDARALELFNGAATTVLRYGSAFRQPGWMSFYCLAHRQLAGEKYHLIHVGQFLALYRLTGAAAFARLSDTYRSDYPKPQVRRRIRVMPGSYTAVRFDGAGRVIATRTARVARAITLSVIRRERIRHQSGYWFTATSGPWAGFRLRERAGRVYVPGAVCSVSYDPPRRLILPAGRQYVGRRYDADGAVVSEVRFTPDGASSAVVGRRAFVNGADQVRVLDGPLAGYWVRLGPAELR